MPWMLPAAIVGSTLIGSLSSSKAAKTAANASADATAQQVELARQQFDQTRQDLAPYSQAGQTGINALLDRMKAGGGSYGNQTDMQYTAPDPYKSGTFSFTPADYQSSPGFQFQLQKGLDTVNSNMAARGASNSGAAQKALASYATGLLNQDYNNQRNFAYDQFNNDRNFGYNQSLNDRNFGYGQYTDQRNYLTGRYDTGTNALMGLVGIGQNAAAGTGNAGANYASAAGNAYANNAATIGNAAMANASNTSNLMGQGVNALAYYYGNRSPVGSAAASYPMTSAGGWYGNTYPSSF